MLREYKNYVQNQDERNCRFLLEKIYDYPFKSDWTDEITECFKVYSHKGNHLFFDANNFVSNTIKSYTFGPIIVLPVIEYLLEKVPKDNTFKLNTTLFSSIYKDDYVGIAPFKKNWDVDLINYFCSLYVPKVNLYAAPNLYFYLVKSKVFQDFCGAGRIGTIVTTGEPAIFDKSLLKKTNVFVNDTMINWKSGLNFYTCLANKKHFFPLFYWKGTRYYNLLNLWDRRGIEIDDLFQAKKEAVICDCGKPRIEFNFIPHYRNYPKTINCKKLQEIIESAEEHYFNYQFVEINDRVSCLKTKLDDQEGYFFKVGAKRPAFWRVNNLHRKNLNEDTYFHCPEEVAFNIKDLDGTIRD